MGFWKDVLKEMGRQAGGSWGVQEQLLGKKKPKKKRK